MILDTLATFHFGADGPDDYNPVDHTFGDSKVQAETRTVNSTTMSRSRAWQEYGITDLKLLRIRSLDELPDNFEYVEVDGVHYQQIDRQEIGAITTITGKEVL